MENERVALPFNQIFECTAYSGADGTPAVKVDLKGMACIDLTAEAGLRLGLALWHAGRYAAEGVETGRVEIGGSNPAPFTVSVFQAIGGGGAVEMLLPGHAQTRMDPPGAARIASMLITAGLAARSGLIGPLDGEVKSKMPSDVDLRLAAGVAAVLAAEGLVPTLILNGP